jgi:flagellar assembly protein FliH
LVQATERARHEILEASERDLVRLALVIAEKVVGRELTTDPTIIALWARQGLEALEGQDNLEVIISPDIANAVPADAWTTTGGQAVTPRVDPELAPGSCSVRGEFTRIDASLAARMQSISAAIGASEG